MWTEKGVKKGWRNRQQRAERGIKKGTDRFQSGKKRARERRGSGKERGVCVGRPRAFPEEFRLTKGAHCWQRDSGRKRGTNTEWTGFPLCEQPLFATLITAVTTGTVQWYRDTRVWTGMKKEDKRKGKDWYKTGEQRCALWGRNNRRAQEIKRVEERQTLSWRDNLTKLRHHQHFRTTSRHWGRGRRRKKKTTAKTLNVRKTKRKKTVEWKTWQTQNNSIFSCPPLHMRGRNKRQKRSGQEDKKQEGQKGEQQTCKEEEEASRAKGRQIEELVNEGPRLTLGYLTSALLSQQGRCPSPPPVWVDPDQQVPAWEKSYRVIAHACCGLERGWWGQGVRGTWFRDPYQPRTRAMLPLD